MIKIKLLDGDESHVLRDITAIMLMPKDWQPFKKENGSWVLDPGNNLFLMPLGDNIYELSSRYVDDRIEAIATILEWRGPYSVVE